MPVLHTDRHSRVCRGWQNSKFLFTNAVNRGKVTLCQKQMDCESRIQRFTDMELSLNDDLKGAKSSSTQTAFCGEKIKSSTTNTLSSLPGYEKNPDGSEGPSLYYDLADQTRWINHSCAPNTEVDSSWDERQKMAQPWWFAVRDIEIGDELTYDYAFSAHLAIPCHCGSPLCRGLIVDEDELDEVPAPLKKHLRNHQHRRAS